VGGGWPSTGCAYPSHGAPASHPEGPATPATARSVRHDAGSCRPPAGPACRSGSPFRSSVKACDAVTEAWKLCGHGGIGRSHPHRLGGPFGRAAGRMVQLDDAAGRRPGGHPTRRCVLRRRPFLDTPWRGAAGWEAATPTATRPARWSFSNRDGAVMVLAPQRGREGACPRGEP
jgi:hypothetical protein